MKIINENDLTKLKLMAGVSEEDITETVGSRKGIEFNFDNSLKADYCKIVEYQVAGEDRYIMQLRKRSTDFHGNKKDKLVFEGIIKSQEFKDVFQKETGIYLDLY